jgi:hypothetical protein
VLEFGSQLTLAIQRPSKAIGRFDSRDGGSSTTVLDGEAIWVYIAKENIYDTTSQPGDIDVSLDFLARQLGIPRRIVITYRQIEGQPQFWAQFTEWDFSPKLSDTTFTFSPPGDAQRVRFFSDLPRRESE